MNFHRFLFTLLLPFYFNHLAYLQAENLQNISFTYAKMIEELPVQDTREKMSVNFATDQTHPYNLIIRINSMSKGQYLNIINILFYSTFSYLRVLCLSVLRYGDIYIVR